MNRSSGGSAAGRYQFIQSTMEDRAKLLFGPNYKNIQFSEIVQETLQDENLIDGATRLKKEGIPITERNLYLMHFKGQVRFVKEILAADPKELVKSLKSWSPDDTNANESIANKTIGDYLKSLNDFSTQPIKYEDLTPSKNRYKELGRNSFKRIDKIQELDGDKRSYDILTEPTLSDYEDFNHKFEKNQYGKIIPKQHKREYKEKVSIIINNETTMLGSNNPRSGLSIPTSPDNNAFYPYTA
jgi:hypothetical protein